MNEKFRDHEVTIAENITRLVLESKLKNLPFAILKKAVPNPPQKDDFNAYKKYINKDLSRIQIEKENLEFFPEWNGIQKALTKIYGNPPNVYNSLMQTNEYSINKVHASLHCDQSDVIHLCCYGSVEWLLIDPEDKEEYRITLEPGDVLYMRGFVLHETTPLSSRGSLIFMNLSYDDFPEPDHSDLTDEERKLIFKKQREYNLNKLNS